jgi:hypothetical protein
VLAPCGLARTITSTPAQMAHRPQYDMTTFIATLTNECRIDAVLWLWL